MRSLRLALAQIDPIVGDLSGNVQLMRRWLAKAERAGADIAVFPELAITGYPPEDLVRQLKPLAAGVGNTAVVAGFVDRTDRGIHNAAAMLWRRSIRGIYHKVRLPNYGVFDEIRTFTPGDRYPVFVLSGVQVGVSIC